MVITMNGDGNQASKTQSNYKAGKFCNTCSQAHTNRCTRTIIAATGSTTADDAVAASRAQIVLERLALCWAYIEGSPNDRSNSTCNKWGIGTSV